MLPSQTARPVRQRVYTNRSRRRPRRKIAAVLLVLLGVLTTIGVLMGRDDQAPEPAQATAVTDGPDKPPVSSAAIDPTHAAAPPRTTQAAAASPRPAPPRQSRPDASDRVAAGSGAPARSPAPAPPPPSGEEATQLMERALALAETNRPVEARSTMTRALSAPDLSAADAAFLRDALTSLNRRLVFSPQVVPGDPYCRVHVVGPGELLSTIVKDQGLQVDWRFIVRINAMRSARHLRAGQRLKLVTGPFHAVVDKSDYRLDLYLGDGADRVFVASFDVGLGEYDSTPVGRFRVRPDSKLINPAWTNPRTREHYVPDDPANPIGEHWIGLKGVDEANRDLAGYGIHGTIEIESIGTQASMGCVRMRPDDVALIYEVLTERGSTVQIVP